MNVWPQVAAYYRSHGAVVSDDGDAHLNEDGGVTLLRLSIDTRDASHALATDTIDRVVECVFILARGRELPGDPRDIPSVADACGYKRGDKSVSEQIRERSLSAELRDDGPVTH